MFLNLETLYKINYTTSFIINFRLMMHNYISELGILGTATRLRILSENLTSMIKEFYQSHDLDFEPRYFPLLKLLKQYPNISLADAAKQLGVSHAAINANVTALYKKDLVDIVKDTQDARAKSLSLTYAGEILYTRLEPAWFILKKSLEDNMPQNLINVLYQAETTYHHRDIEKSLSNYINRDYVLQHLSLEDYDISNPAHKQNFAALNIEWLEKYFHVEPIDYEIFNAPEEVILKNDGVILFASIQGQIIGTGAIIKRSDEIYEIAKMAVSNMFQGLGIGKKILNCLINRLQKKGLKKAYLMSSTQLPQAVPMYRKMGFITSSEPIHERYARGNITLEKELMTEPV